ncbi:MAG: hypothetical protein ACKOYK_06720, partial [Cyanobium sp.]
MLRFVFVSSGVLSSLMLLPAVAATPQPAATRSPMAPITLTEAKAIGPIAQAVDPSSTQQRPAPIGDSAPSPTPPEPAPSPWAGTLELYGFAPLRATTSLTRGATQRDLSSLFRKRPGDRKPGQLAPKAGGKLEALPDLTYPDGLKDRPLGFKLPDEIEIPGFTAVTDVGLGSILEHLT